MEEDWQGRIWGWCFVRSCCFLFLPSPFSSFSSPSSSPLLPLLPSSPPLLHFLLLLVFVSRQEKRHSGSKGYAWQSKPPESRSAFGFHSNSGGGWRPGPTELTDLFSCLVLKELMHRKQRYQAAKSPAISSMLQALV